MSERDIGGDYPRATVTVLPLNGFRDGYAMVWHSHFPLSTHLGTHLVLPRGERGETKVTGVIERADNVRRSANMSIMMSAIPPGSPLLLPMFHILRCLCR